MMTNSEERPTRPERHPADRGASSSADFVNPPCDEPVRLAGPVATLQVTVGALAALAIVLALTAGRAPVVLTALGVIGLIPLTLGAVVRGHGWRRRGGVARREREEDAAIVTPVAVLCWQPIVLITDLREQIFHGGMVAMTAGAAALALSIYCARP
jgi:hypothetical protein